MKYNHQYAVNAVITGMIVIMILVIIFAFIKLFFYSSFEHNVAEFISIYGFFAVFIISFILDVVMQPLGPDIVIVGAILLNFNWIHVFFWAICGSVIGSFVSYWIGKIYGKVGFKNKFYNKYYQKANKFYLKYGKIGLGVAALSPLPYVPFCWIAGVFSMKKTDFILFGLIPRALRFIILAYIIHLIMVF